MRVCGLECMGGCAGVWVRECVGAWVRGCVGAWARGCMGAWVCGCMGGDNNLCINYYPPGPVYKM